MTRLLEAMTSFHSDAIILQKPAEVSNDLIDYQNVHGIIRRIHTEWSFHTVMLIRDELFIGFGIQGDTQNVVNAAGYQFGSSLSDLALMVMDYTHPCFPKHLLPKEFFYGSDYIVP